MTAPGAASASPSPGSGPRWVDSHCHLPVARRPRRGPRRPPGRAGVAGRGVRGDRPGVLRGPPSTWPPREPDVWATVGLHPHDAARLDEEWAALEALARTASRVVAVGEAGFDLHYEHSPRGDAGGRVPAPDRARRTSSTARS